MTTLRTAAQQALEALAQCGLDDSRRDYGMERNAITALKAALTEDALQRFTDVNQEIEAALAEPVPVPVPVAAWENKYGMKEWEVHALRAGWMPAPPQRKPLTEEAIQQCFKEAGITIKGQHWTNAVRNVERAHGIT
jgi:hypothetical protein